MEQGARVPWWPISEDPKLDDWRCGLICGSKIKVRLCELYLEVCG